MLILAESQAPGIVWLAACGGRRVAGVVAGWVRWVAEIITSVQCS